MNASGAPDLPCASALKAQSERLAGLRNHLLRHVGIAHRDTVLDLGCGWGSVSHSLRRRAARLTVALDHHAYAVRHAERPALVADAHRLPFAPQSFDLIFTQFVWLWLQDLHTVLNALKLILRPGGVIVAVEPDFVSMTEHPPQIALRDIWCSALKRAGAKPDMGSQLPTVFEQSGLFVTVHLADAGRETVPDLTMMQGLPLTAQESWRVEQVRNTKANDARVHLPVVGILAEKRRR